MYICTYYVIIYHIDLYKGVKKHYVSVQSYFKRLKRWGASYFAGSSMSTNLPVRFIHSVL